MSEDKKELIVEALRTIFDPEIPVNIYDLGLIYEVRIDDGNRAYIKMTLTSPTCPVAPQILEEVQQKSSAIEGIEHSDVDLVWDPPWTQDLLSEAAKLQLGLG